MEVVKQEEFQALTSEDIDRLFKELAELRDEVIGSKEQVGGSIGRIDRETREYLFESIRKQINFFREKNKIADQNWESLKDKINQQYEIKNSISLNELKRGLMKL